MDTQNMEYFDLDETLINSFETLCITPTINKAKIISAYRLKALKLHPDKFQNEKDKSKAHEDFIQLAIARDNLIEILSNPNFVKWIKSEFINNSQFQKEKSYSKNSSFNNKNTNETIKSKKTSKNDMTDKIRKDYEKEWEEFIKNEKSYLSFFKTSSNIMFEIFLMLIGGVILGF